MAADDVVGPVDPSGEPLRNTALVEAMRNVSLDDTPDTRALLFQLLLESTLVVATPDAPAEPGSRIAGAGEHLALVTLEDEEGAVLPVFTSVEALVRWRPEGGGYLALPARSLFEMVAAGPPGKVVLDPGSPTWGIITSGEVAVLAKGRLPLGSTEVVAEETSVLIGRPANPPPAATLAVVREALAAEPAVEAAWLCLIQQGDGRSELVVGVRLRADVQGDAERTAMRGVVDAAGARDDAVRSLAFLRVDADLEATLAGGAGEELFRR